MAHGRLTRESTSPSQGSSDSSLTSSDPRIFAPGHNQRHPPQIPTTIVAPPATGKSKSQYRTRLAWWARQAITKWERDGAWGAIFGAIRKLIRHYQRVEVRYDQWIASHEPDELALRHQRKSKFESELLVSLVVSVESNSTIALQSLVASLQSQTYPHWELCIASPVTNARSLQASLTALCETEHRIRIVQANGAVELAGRLNATLQNATGDWIAIVSENDTLAPFALYEIVCAVDRHRDADFLYSDEDQIATETCLRYEPRFKPAWSPDLLRSFNYFGRLAVIRKTLLDRVGQLRPEFHGAHEYDLHLRATELATRIIHVPQVLCHSKSAGNFTTAAPVDPVANDSARRALTEHLDRRSTPGIVRHGKLPGQFHIQYALPCRPLVSIIIPNRDQVETLSRCINSLWQTDYDHREIIIVENGSRDPRTHAYYESLLQTPQVKIVRFNGEFNYSAVVNLGVAHSRGEVVLQLNNDTQAINSDWLERMLEHALRPEVGAVGAKLYFPDNDRIQHAGAIVGLGGAAGHALIDEPGDAIGYSGRLVTIQNCSIVTGACLMTRRAVYDEVGGLDESFPLDCNDSDFCLKILDRGYFNVWTPLAELYHFESLTRGAAPTAQRLAHLEAAVQRFRKKWATMFRDGDPYYNPNLSLNAGGYGLRLDAPRIPSRAA